MRLIDADAIIKEIKARNPDDVSYEDAWAITCIEHATTIEPQEIIRCKDCKYRYIDEKFGPSCELDTGDPYATGRNADEDDWFCEDAERRTE